jgi:hypothetical protein
VYGKNNTITRRDFGRRKSNILKESNHKECPRLVTPLTSCDGLTPWLFLSRRKPECQLQNGRKMMIE